MADPDHRDAASLTADGRLASGELLATCAQAVPTAGQRTLELKGIAEPVAAVVVEWSEPSEP